MDTELIISGYENKLSQNIASKTLAASKRGEVPDFTKEEILYLNKKSSENDDTELNVITPPPNITIKKGKTELNIRHAAALVQKMEEKYPTAGRCGVEQTASYRIPAPDELDDLKRQLPQTISTPITEFNEIPGGFEQPPIKTVNKNAYEIREAILSHALGWVQYVAESKRQNNVSIPTPTEDDVISVAQKFYKFVENRR